MCGLICVCLLLSQTGKRNFQAQKLKKKMEDNQDFSNPNGFSAILSSTWVAKPIYSSKRGAPRFVALEPRRTRTSYQLTLCWQNFGKALRFVQQPNALLKQHIHWESQLPCQGICVLTIPRLGGEHLTYLRS